MMYKSKSSLNAQDFLRRLYYLFDGQIKNIQTDNGSEFQGLFEKAAQELNLIRYFSRPRTPKDNPVNERFNRTLKEEFLDLGNFHPDPKVFNPKLRDWLCHVMTVRPHEALGYKTPIEVAWGKPELLKMYSSDTGFLFPFIYGKMKTNETFSQKCPEIYPQGKSPHQAGSY